MRVVAHREKLQSLRLQIRSFLGRSATDWVCLGPGGPLSSGTLWRRGYVRRSTELVSRVSQAGQWNCAVKLKANTPTMQRPTSTHHRRSLPTISLDPPPLPPARLPSLSSSTPSKRNPTRHARERYSRENSNNLPITRFCRRRRLCTNTPSQSRLIALETINLPPLVSLIFRNAHLEVSQNSGPFFTKAAKVKILSSRKSNIHDLRDRVSTWISSNLWNASKSRRLIYL